MNILTPGRPLPPRARRNLACGSPVAVHYAHETLHARARWRALWRLGILAEELSHHLLACC